MDIEKILEQMSLKDKIALCSGKNFWQTKEFKKYGIPSMFMCDGPHGLRKQEKSSDMLGVNKSRQSTCFPAAVTTAGSWDPEVTKSIGKAIGEEARDQNVGLVLGPGANMKRNPLCGRNFEYFSEDPFLAGKMASGFITGVEGEGVGTSLKHFAGNSQELDRFVSDGLMDERTLREIYLPAFEIAVKESQPSTVMCAYPKLNGKHCSGHKELLTDILRDEWGFQGFVVTDWGAMEDRIEGFEAGCDLSMPGGSAYMENDVLKAVERGELSEALIDASARRILKLVFRADETLNGQRGQQADSVTGEKSDGAMTATNEENARAMTTADEESASVATSRDSESAGTFFEGACDYEKHHQIARMAAASGAVLLKNDNNILPLRKGMHIALIGHMARDIRFQGSGSSHINPAIMKQPIEVFGLGDAAAKSMPGKEIDAKNAVNFGSFTYAQGCTENGDTTEELISEAVKAATECEAAVVFAGLTGNYESEGFDRDNMLMPVGHLKMIEAVANANPNTIVVLLCGSPVECPWADLVKGILYMGLPGQAGAEAIADLLYGAVNPSGRLAETWPMAYADVPSSEIFAKSRDAIYEEGIYVGYRYYDKAGVQVRWPFGYGLSYTQFEYSDLKIEKVHNGACEGDNDSGRFSFDDCNCYTLQVSCKVTNVGSVDGAEVVQLFVGAPQDGIHRPIRTLAGFKKLFIKAGETEEVVITLGRRSFAIWQDGWKVPKGTYDVLVGDLQAQVIAAGITPLEIITADEPASGNPVLTISIPADQVTVPDRQKGGWYDTLEDKPTLEGWEEMSGMKYIVKTPVKGEFTMENTIIEMKDHSGLMKLMYKAVTWGLSLGYKGDSDNPEYKMIINASMGGPIRNIQISGGIKGGLFRGMVKMANGHLLKGFAEMFKK